MEKINAAKALYISITGVLAAAGSAIAAALGGWDHALITLVIVMAIDYITGILCALVWKKSQKSADGAFESKASFKGLLRKGMVLLVVLIAVQLDRLAFTDGYIRTAVVLFFIANDGFSIIENLGIMGIPLPAALKNAFAAIKTKSEKSDAIK